MGRVENEFRARRIISFFQEHQLDRMATLHHFLQEGIPRNTIGNVISRFLRMGQVGYKPIPGRKPVINTKRQQNKVIRHCRKFPSLSERVRARKLKLARSTLQDIKKSIGIRRRKKQKKPKYNNGQIERCKRWSGKLYKKSVPSGGNFFFVLDDETYVPKDPTQVMQPEFYDELPGEETPVEHTIVQTGKFESKLMVWQAIAEDGDVSEPFVTDCTINAQIYQKECIENRLIPFLAKKKSERPLVFWPDLATAHYAGAVTACLKNAGVHFVPKNENPPNLPQCRPIERFWSHCKRRYHEENKPADNIKKMTRIWKRISSEIAAESGKNFFEHFRKNLRTCSKNGPLKV